MRRKENIYALLFLIVALCCAFFINYLLLSKIAEKSQNALINKIVDEDTNLFKAEIKTEIQHFLKITKDLMLDSDFSKVLYKNDNTETLFEDIRDFYTIDNKGDFVDGKKIYDLNLSLLDKVFETKQSNFHISLIDDNFLITLLNPYVKDGKISKIFVLSFRPDNIIKEVNELGRFNIIINEKNHKIDGDKYIKKSTINSGFDNKSIEFYVKIKTDRIDGIFHNYQTYLGFTYAVFFVIFFALIFFIYFKFLNRLKVNITNFSSKNILDATLKSISEGVVSCDISGRIIGINRIAEFFTGWSYAEALGKKREEVLNINEKIVKQNHNSNDYNCVLLSKNKKEYYISLSHSPLLDNQNKVIGVVTTFRDMTYKYKKEQEIKEIERKYELLIENALSGIASYTPVFDENHNIIDYVILSVNRAFEKHIGIKKDKLIGCRIGDIWGNDDKNPFLSLFNKIRNEKIAINSQEYFAYMKKYINVNAYILEGDVLGTILTDNTYEVESRKQLIDLINRQNLFNNVLKILNLPFNNEQEIPSITEIIKSSMKYDNVSIRIRDDFKIKDSKEKFVMSVNEYGEYSCICDVFKNNTDLIKFFNINDTLIINDFETIELSNINLNLNCGNYREMTGSLLMVPIKIETNQIGFLQIINEIENSFLPDDVDLLENISSAIGVAISRKKNNENLKIAMENADKANKSKSEFLANMSHEIRTPINAVLGLAQLMPLTKEEDKKNDYANKILASGNSLLFLINNILDFSKIEAGKLSLSKHLFSLEDLLKNLSTILAYSSKNKNIEIVFDVDKNIPRKLVGDIQRLEQVLINLMSNAAKFTTEGYVLLKVSLLSIMGNIADIEFIIEDTGIGISKDNLQRIFEPFEQEDLSTSKKYGGTGLGLSISKNIVSMMGGEISASSELNKGTKFRFNGKFEFKELNREDKSYLGLNVLLIDDSPVYLEVMTHLLKDMDFNTTTFESVITALDFCKSCEDKIDIIFVDIKMLKLNGIDFVKKFKELNIPNSPKFILVSCMDVTNDEDNMLFDAKLQKPVTKNMVMDAISLCFDENKKKENTKNISMSKKLEDINILLVDDNEINLELAENILLKHGAKVTTAVNGLDAIDKTKVETVYDIILMDVQMPYMDGYKTSLMVREDERYKDIPIIALTANAMKEDKEKCIAAKMNDHIPKPFNINEMIDIIKNWVSLNKNETVIEVKNETDNSSKEPLNWYEKLPVFEYIDMDMALNWNSFDKEMLLKTINKFINKYNNIIIEINTLYNEGKIEELRELLHSMKGVSGVLGASKLYDILSFAEGKLKTQDTSTLVEDMKNIEKVFEKTINDFTRIKELIHE